MLHQPAIKIEKLSKKFTVAKSQPGVLGAIRGLFFPDQIEVSAIKELTFEIQTGERVAFIGPNGAGSQQQ